MQDEILLKVDVDELIKCYLEKYYPNVYNDRNKPLPTADECDIFHLGGDESFDPVMIEVWSGCERSAEIPEKKQNARQLPYNFIEGETLTVIVALKRKPKP